MPTPEGQMCFPFVESDGKDAQVGWLGSGIPFWIPEDHLGRRMRIPNHFLDCSIYLYSSESQAREGALDGGSGFLVKFPLEMNPNKHQLYAVTNWHVIEKQKNPVIRLNKLSGGIDTLQTNLSRWEMNGRDDLAVLPLAIVEEDYKFSSIAVKDFMARRKMEDFGIGPGDQVFMVGRFISHEGKQKNTPSVRFGMIAQMPDEPAINKYKQEQEQFLVDCRSIPGYSGSPVFVYLVPTVPHPPEWIVDTVYNPDMHGPWLLGVDYSHPYNFEPVLDKDEKRLDPKQQVRANTGMAGVIPAWRLLDLLEALNAP